MRLVIRKSILLTIFTISLFLCTCFSTISYSDIIRTDSKYQDITSLKWMGPYGSYEDYISQRTNQNFFIKNIKKTKIRDDNPYIIVFVNSNLIDELDAELDIYNLNLVANNYNTMLIETSGGTAEDLKLEIQSYWDSGYNITGVVLVGDHPTAWYYLAYDGSDFPCDLFLMDLDGDWDDTNGDGMYDSHTYGDGDTAPEIYVGRIDASNIPGDEIGITKDYFYKVNEFWIGNIQHTDYGLTYTEPDWSYINDIRFSMEYAYPNYQAIWDPNVNRDDYVDHRVCNDTYEFIQLACHSWSGGHSFTYGGYAYSDDVRNAPPMALFYNLFCCGATRFTDYNCLGNAYILDTNSPSLSVVGSTKSGSMLDFYFYYQALADHSFGKAFQLWFEFEAPYDNSDKMWFYGMTILGDPTLVIWGGNINTSPYPPEKPVGPDYGKVGYQYSFSSSTIDPQGDQIYYMWNWGDELGEWIGPFNSGEIIYASHIWSYPDLYSIKVKAKDETGLESDWSKIKYIEIIAAPIIEIGEISGGFGVKAEIKNVGFAEAINVDWVIQLKGLVLIGREKSGTFDKIYPGFSPIASSGLVLGIGPVEITVIAVDAEKKASGFIIGPFVIIN